MNCERVFYAHNWSFVADRSKFRFLSRKLAQEVPYYSVDDEAVKDPTFRRFVGLGMSAFPRLIHKCKNSTASWVDMCALRDIAEENNIPLPIAAGKNPDFSRSARGNIAQWGQENGFIKRYRKRRSK